MRKTIIAQSKWAECPSIDKTHDLSHTQSNASWLKKRKKTKKTYTKHIKSVARRRCQCLGFQWWRCCVRGGSTLSWHWEWRSVLHVTSLDAHGRRSCSCLWLFPPVLQHHRIGQHQTTRPSFTFPLRIAVCLTWLYGNISHWFGQVKIPRVRLGEEPTDTRRRNQTGRKTVPV